MDIIHCLFEQSGTFKNEFLKLGFTAFDYDILNDFGQTDFIIDLFDEIHKAYLEEPSIFDTFNNSDLIIAFFPCIRFENEIIMHFQGNCRQLKNKDDLYKLENSLRLHGELSNLYNVITKLVIICLKRNLKLIIENPYSSQHYLTRYWPIKPAIIDLDRKKMGDYYKKPTQYFFINFEPHYNFIFEPVDIKIKRRIKYQSTVERSLISSDYANRFIREFII